MGCLRKRETGAGRLIVGCKGVACIGSTFCCQRFEWILGILDTYIAHVLVRVGERPSLTIRLYICILVGPVSDWFEPFQEGIPLEWFIRVAYRLSTKKDLGKV